jgi:predicted MFS family arabinose efflux permease
VSIPSLLRRSPHFRSLFVSRAVSEFGTWFAYIALTVVVYERTGSARWVSALLLLDLLPSIALGYLAGRLLDRVVRKRLLVGAELVSAGVFVGLALVDSLGALFALAAVAGIASSVFRPSIRAAIPSLVDDRDLPQANSLVRTAAAAAVLAGPPFAGVLVGVGGTTFVLSLNAASFAVSAALVARIPRDRLQSAPQPKAGRGSNARRLFAPPALRAVLVSWTLSQLAWGLVNVSEVVVARRVFHVGAAGFGLLAACAGAGLLGGSLASGRLAERVSTGVLYRNALLVAALGLGVGATARWFWLALVCAGIGAAGNALALAAADLTIQRGVAPERLGEAFGVFYACVTAAAVTATAAAGFAIDALGGRTAWGLAAATALVSAAVAVTLSREKAIPVSDALAR